MKINSWSAGSVKIFGYETEEVIREPFEIIFTDEDKKEGIPKKEINTAIKEGRAVDNRWHICKDGSVFYAYGLVFPLKGEDGKLIGYVKILRDLTERKKSEEGIKKYIKELEELNTHKERILAILSHDLRSPLTSIILAAGHLKSNIETIKPAEAKKLLEYLYKASVDELNVLDYLLEWARIKYASEAFIPTNIELSDYVKKIFDTLKGAASLNTINLHQEIEENTNVFADGKMPSNIHIKEERLRSRPKKSEDRMIVEIKDTGIGMSKEVQEKLFIPHIQSLAIARKENKGAGIGLLLVKGFLEKMAVKYG